MSFQATVCMTLISVVLVGVVVAAYANLILDGGEVPARLGAAVFVTLLALLVAGIPVLWSVLAWVVHVQWWQQRLLFGRPVLVSEPKLQPGEPQLLVFEGFRPRAQAQNLHAMWVFEVGHRNAQNWSNQEQSSAEPLIWSNQPAWFTASQHDKLQAQVTLRPPSNELFYRRTQGDGNFYSRDNGSTRWALLVVTEANLRHKGRSEKLVAKLDRKLLHDRGAIIRDSIEIPPDVPNPEFITRGWRFPVPESATSKMGLYERKSLGPNDEPEVD
jgi:hypothetical protein